MGRVRRIPQPGADRSEWSRRGYLSAVWYLRAVAPINFLGAVWVYLGNDIQRHNDDKFFTPYLLTAGFFSGVLSMFLAITMRRRKRAAWILFALRHGKSVTWSPPGRSAVAYRVVGGVSLASGEPIGDPEAWPGAIDATRRGRHRRVHDGRPFHAECSPSTPPCRARRVHGPCQPSRGHVGGRDGPDDRVGRRLA